MATIRDVAERAGVSRSTVSHALSGKRPISRETKERIFAAIDELGFTANAGARALATSRSSIFGLVVPFNADEFAPATLQYVLAVTETSRELGYDVLLVTDDIGVGGIRRVTKSGLVDGLLVMDVKRTDDRVPALIEAQRPTVMIGTPDADIDLDYIDLDYAAAGRMLVERLAREGHREVIFLTLPEEVFAFDLAYAWRLRHAAQETAARLGILLRTVQVATEPELRGRQVRAALDAYPSATGLLVHNDAALTDLPTTLLERRLQLPKDLSVISLFPDGFGRMFSLPFTAIETSAPRVAERAVQLLADRVAHPDRPVHHELVAPVIVERGSVGPA